MRIKAIIFDLDGMLVQSERFSERLADKLHIPLDRITPFFKTRFPLCVIGQADLKDELKKAIPIWGWEESVDELLSFWFQPAHNRIDERFGTLIKELRGAGMKTYLATNNEKYRTEDLVNRRGLGQWFDEVFSSPALGVKKPETAFFEVVIKKIGERPEEILFWDNDMERVEAARALGMKAEVYTNFEEFESKIKEL